MWKKQVYGKCMKKQMYGNFKRQTSDLSREKTWTWLEKGKLKRETEFLLIAAENNAIRTNYIKSRINKTQQNSRFWLCGDRDEMINHIISECRKLALKMYEPRHDRLGKVIHRELFKIVKFDQTNMVYTQPQNCPGEGDTQTSLEFRDTNGSLNLGQTNRPCNCQEQQKQQKKRTFRIVDFVVPADQKVKLKESKKKDWYLNLARELKKLCNVKGMVTLIVIGALDRVTKRLVQGLDGLVWFVGFYGVSTFIGYLTPNPFLCK